MTELLRLHLLGSGFERLQVTARFDYQQRGGYDSVDDPALDFRRRDTAILKMLAETSIYNLSAGSFQFTRLRLQRLLIPITSDRSKSAKMQNC